MRQYAKQLSLLLMYKPFDISVSSATIKISLSSDGTLGFVRDISKKIKNYRLFLSEHKTERKKQYTE